MKTKGQVQALQRNYMHRLFTDRSVEDKMPIFVEAKRIFRLLKRKRRKSK